MMKQSILFLLSLVFLSICPSSPAGGQERVVQAPNFHKMASAHVRVLFQDKEGYIWYGMKSDGLYRDDGYGLTNFRADFLHPEVMMNNEITALCEDNSNRLWIGTKRGLYILDKKDYSFHPTGDQKLQIWTFDALKASMGDSVWAYANQHVLVYDSQGHCISQTPAEKNPLVTQNRKEVTDQRGNLWSIDDNGIPYVALHPTAELEEVELTSLPLCGNVPATWAGLPGERRIHSVWRSPDSTKYVSTHTGVWVLKPDSPNGEPEQVGPNFGVVKALSPGEDGTIYMNTEWQGLISYKNGIITKLDTAIRNATSLFYDQEKLWISTSDGRLLLYDINSKTMDDKSKECCLQGDSPIDIAVVEGKVWMLFNQRLLIYSPRKAESDKVVLRYIFPADLEPRPAFFRRLYTDGISRIFLECEQKSFELKLHDEGQRVKTMAKIHLASYFTSSGTYCPGMDTHLLNLKSDERYVHLFFTTLDHLHTPHVRFAFRNQGDKEWNYLEMGQNEIYLTELSKGEHTIEVIATNADGLWIENPYTLTINCQPRWWETIWAYIAYTLAAVLMLCLCFWAGRKTSHHASR